MLSKPIYSTFARLGFRIPEARPQQDPTRTHPRASANAPLCVMKFGGTSVGDAVCIERVAQIIQDGARKGRVAVVVSAMSGVTNKLMEAAAQSAAGNSDGVATIFQELRQRHEEAADRLIAAQAARSALTLHMASLFQEGQSRCQRAILAKELTAQTRDAIASLGERLAAPLVAATLAERGLVSEAVEATDLIVTNANFGSADPCVDATRQRCEARLLPLIHRGAVPVITGFIGATPDGLLTTLGRGGSDYSATILGAALDATEVIIWTDVDGVLSADPRLVSDARTIPEISYREAADLAHFGAKVLHPKTLQPVMQFHIPVWIRNSFSPNLVGTKITPGGLARGGAVKAVTSISDAQLISLVGRDIDTVRDIFGRAGAVAARIRGDAWFLSTTQMRDRLQLAVSAPFAQRTIEALRREFSEELSRGTLEGIGIGASVAIVTLVGQDFLDLAELRRRSSGALDRVQIGVMATAERSSGCTLSFGIAPEKMKTALAAIHQEFQLHALDSQSLPSHVL